MAADFDPKAQRPGTRKAIIEMVDALERYANTDDDRHAYDAMWHAAGAWNGLRLEGVGMK